MKTLIQKAKNLLNRGMKKTVGALTAMGVLATTSMASAAPATGNTSIDTIVSEFVGGFDVARIAFIALAIASVAITLVVVVFFWLRNKFKQSVAGA